MVFITELFVQALIICSLPCAIRKGWCMNGWKAVTRRREWGQRLQGHIVPSSVCRVELRCFSFLWRLVPFRFSRTVLELGLYLEGNWLVWLCARGPCLWMCHWDRWGDRPDSISRLYACGCSVCSGALKSWYRKHGGKARLTFACQSSADPQVWKQCWWGHFRLCRRQCRLVTALKKG